MSAESLLAYKVTDSTDSPGHEDVYIWGKPSFLLPYCLSIIKMSLLSCVPIYYIHPLPAPDQPLASILPVRKERSPPLDAWPVPVLCLLSPSLLESLPSFCASSTFRRVPAQSFLSAFSLSPLLPPCHPRMSHRLPAFRPLEMSPFP